MIRRGSGATIGIPSGKGCRGRFLPHTSTFLCLIMSSVRMFEYLLGARLSVLAPETTGE